MASLSAACGGGGGVEPEATAIEEVVLDGGQEEEAHTKGGLSEEYPATPMVTEPSSALDISLTHRTSSSSSRHYAKLLSARASRSTVGALVLGQLNCGNHPFFTGLFPLLEDMDLFFNRVLSVEGNIC